MLTEENTYFLRAFLLLVEGGGYISTEILDRERQNEGGDFDDLLRNFERKLRHEFHGKQYEKLFPSAGNTNTETWDLQLKIGVMLNIFRHTLSLTEKGKLRTLRELRNDIFMHCVSASLDHEKYEEVQEQLEDAIETLASTFADSVKNCCSAYIRQCTVEPLDNLRPSIATLNGLTPASVRAVHVPLDVELRVVCLSEELADLSYTALNTIFNLAASNTDEETDSKELGENVRKLLDFLESHKDVVFKGSNIACIILKFECRSYAGMLCLLHKLQSPEFRVHLNDIADVLMRLYQHDFPINISSKVTTECLQSVLIDIIKTVHEEEQSIGCFEVVSDNKMQHSDGNETQLKQFTDDDDCQVVESTKALKLALECESKDGLFHILNMFKEDSLSGRLTSIADSLSRLYQKKITLKASLNVEEVMTALEEAVSKGCKQEAFLHQNREESGQVHEQDQLSTYEDFKIPFSVGNTSPLLPHSGTVDKTASTSANCKNDATNVVKGNRITQVKKPYSKLSPGTARKRSSARTQAEQKRQGMKVGKQQMDRGIPTVQNAQFLSESDEESIDRKILRRRVSFIKYFAAIKDELSQTVALSIAKQLFPGDHTRISAIESTNRRRSAVELLLKEVVSGPDEMLEDFISLLRGTEEGKFFVETIEAWHVTDFDVNEYFKINSGNQENEEHRLEFSVNDCKTLKSQLNNRDWIDKINDRMLSRCKFSIVQHTEVCKSSTGIKCLLDNLQLCDEYVFNDFTEILISLGLHGLVKNLDKTTQKRKHLYLSESESETEHVSKRMRHLDKHVERCVVKLSGRPNSDVRSKVRKYIGAFDIENVNSGSIVISLKPDGPEAWLSMEESCRTGKIKDFIPELFDHEEVYDQLPEGQVILQLSIYSEQTEETKRAIFVLHDSEEQEFTGKTKYSGIEDQGNPIEDCLCEELDIEHINDLLKELNGKKLVDDRFMQEITELNMRTEKAKHLVKKIYSLGLNGISILKNYLKDKKEYLYQKLREAETFAGDEMEDMSTGSGERQSRGRNRYSAKRKIFFTCTVILQIKKNERVTRAHGRRIEITCPKISDRVCHFEKK
ncbi:uncharacterized protein LOC123545995, partial [Mercenaria mercenaria]|uniref:uncharacterized protein LOC123545995 n=1 Tax=Mercenaria mercenaria TaxID=6596 RepID=UPI00234EE7BA